MSALTNTTLDLTTLESLVSGTEFVSLEPHRNRHGKRNTRWRLLANAELEPDL
jgi:hypothetical protein